MKNKISKSLLAQAFFVAGAAEVFAAAPVANDDIIAAKKDGVIDFDYLHLNDKDSDGDSLTITSVSNPSNGTLTTVGTNHYRYTPNTGFMGRDSFTYTISDGSGGTDTATVSISVNETVNMTAARDKILNNVTSFAAPHWPGDMAVWGETAFSVANYPNEGKDEVLPWIAAATLGQGRVIALPDPKWLEMQDYAGTGSMGQVYKNSIDWLADDSSTAIKIVTMETKAKTWLDAEGYTNVVYSDAASLSSNLTGAKVLIVGGLGSSPLQSTLDSISSFTRSGGGLYICDDVRGWTQGKWDYPANKMLREAGLAFSGEGYSRGALTIDRGDQHLTFDYLKGILQNWGSKTDAERKLASDQLLEVLTTLDPDDIMFARLMTLFNAIVTPIVPSVANPVTDANQKKLLDIEGQIYAGLAQVKPEAVVAHRAALPVSTTARVQNGTYTLSSPAAGHSEKTFCTPFYAAPGEIVTINVPSALTTLGLRVRVSHLRRNNRPLKVHYTVMPDQGIDFALDATQIQVVNPHGGFIQIIVPSNVVWTTGDHTVTVSGAVEAPYFKFGTTTNAQWVAGIRSRGAPFGVLDSPAVTLIVDADLWLRNLSEPHEVMSEWNFFCSSLRDFYNKDSGRQLIVQQDYYPAGGVSSYPQSYARNLDLVDLNILQMYGYGLTIHEYGHRSAHPNIQFHQFQEAVPNISSIWMRHHRKNFSWRYQSPKARISAYIASKNVDLWNQWNHYDTDMKMTPFILLADQFGADKLRDAVHAISATPNLPTSQDRIDAWAKEMSTRTGFNMANFFAAWQLPVSATTATTLSQYQNWMPIEWEPESMTVIEGQAVVFNDPSMNDYSYDGGLTLTEVKQPGDGVIVNNNNGTYTYTPKAGFTGNDNFTYTVKNTTGNTFERTVKVKVIAASKDPKLMVFDQVQVTNVWTTVNLGKTYNNMVVVAQPMVAATGSPPLVSRIRNASGSSFELRLDRLDGSSSAITPTKVRIMVVEKGKYSEAEHGIKMEADTFISQVTDKGGDMVGEKRTLQHGGLNHYRQPVLFGQVMTSNDPKWSACWFMPARAREFVMGKHVGEDPDTTRANETIGYILMESGSYQIGRNQIYASVTSEQRSSFKTVTSSPVEHDFTRFPRIDSALVQATDESGWGLELGGGHDGSITMQVEASGNKVKAYVTEDTLGDTEVEAGVRYASYLLVHHTAGVNNAPVFTANPMSRANATEAVAYTGQTLSGSATDADGDSLTYSKTSGPAWLAVASNGALTGTPGSSDVGANVFTVQVSDGNGGISTATLNITVNAASSGLVLTGGDVGAVGVTGSATGPNTNGVYTVAGSGADIWGSSDSFQYYRQQMTGDMEITAQVLTQQNTHTWAKAGVMIREDLTAGSRNAMMIMTPTRGSVYQYRDSAGGTSSSVPANDGARTPYWVRLTRVGNQLAGYRSVDGVTWTQVGTRSISMSSTVYVGLAVTSHDNSVLSQATFSNVVIRSLSSGNNAPVFTTNPMSRANATEAVAYTGQTLSGSATDADGDSLTYSKVSGPTWLAVASNGALTGTPGSGDVGANAFTVQVSDGNGGTSTATLNITVDAASSGPAGADFSAASVDQSGGANIINLSEGVAVAGQHVTTVANLNAGTSGGTWSDLSVTANVNAAIVVAQTDILTGKWLHIGVDKSANDSTHTSTATLNFDTPRSLGSSTILSLDAYKLGGGGQPGGMYLEGYSSGGEKLFKIAFGNGTNASGPALRGSIRHYNTADTGTDLAAQDAIWNGMQLQNVQLTLDTTGFKIKTTDVQGNSVTYPGLSYVNAMGGNLAKVVFTARQSKASWGLDNISLVGTGGGAAPAPPVVSNNAPVVNDSTLNIEENASVGASVGTVVGMDPDAGDTLSYAITGGNTAGAFAINSSSGEITTAAGLDYETTAQYVLTVTVTDNGTPVASDTATVTVNVVDVTEGPSLTRTTVSNVSSTSWTTVDLGQSYASAIVVATPIYLNSTVAPVVTRIRNVSGSSFELKLDRADGQTGMVTMDVSVIAVEEGVYTQAVHGVTMEAVKYTSTVTSENNSWTAESRSYQNSYTAPVVVGQVMSTNDANWSTFWCQGASRTEPPSVTALAVGKHVGEDTTVTRANESIGYIVIEAGNGTINGIKYTAGVGADTVRGTGNTSTGYSYSLSGLSTASAAAVSLAGLDGSDGGWAVLYGATPLTSTTLTLAVDEDQISNSERNHITEQVGYIVFE